MKENKTCFACRGSNLEVALDLPGLPLTGIYVEALQPQERYVFDQSLLLCSDCGHAQLQFSLDPVYLYQETYSHRSSLSAIARNGNDFFVNFLDSLIQQRSFECIVEVGCNDLYLLKKIASRAQKLVGIDPIWAGRDHRIDDKIQVVGDFVESLDFRAVLGGSPDLVLSAHTFEHLNSPREQLELLIQHAAEEALFLIEVPGFDSLLSTCRFDQIFHQHIQYFSLYSLEQMVHASGGTYLAHTFNYGYWGGTMLMAFQKKNKTISPERPVFSKPTLELVRSRFELFSRQIALVKDLLASQRNPICGFGAAQMLPILAYHMKTDFSFLEGIYDDNTERAGLMYPTLPVKIKKAPDASYFEDKSVLITALDSTRPILKRLEQLKPRTILRPLYEF